MIERIGLLEKEVSDSLATQGVPVGEGNEITKALGGFSASLGEAELQDFRSTWLPVFQAGHGLQERTNLLLSATNRIPGLDEKIVTNWDLRLLERKPSPVWEGVDLEVLEDRKTVWLGAAPQTPDPVRTWNIARHAASGRPLVARCNVPLSVLPVPQVEMLYKFHWRDLRLNKLP